MRKKKQDEIALSVTEAAEEREDAEGRKPEKKGLVKTVQGLMDTANKISPKVMQVFEEWVKPVIDNRAQIRRRLSGISTVFSILFFILYVPFLLFSKIANGLALGWEVALYACVGVYAVTLLALLIVTVASGKSTTTEMAERRKKVRKLILYIVRIASVAISITALVITASARKAEGVNTVLSTLGITFSIVSIVFAALPLVFGGFRGFLKWLISPAKVKRTFSFVALEWFGFLTGSEDKSVKRLYKKYGEALEESLNGRLLPAFGSRYLTAIGAREINDYFNRVDEELRELDGAVLYSVFDYAVNGGYVSENPCAEFGFPENIEDAVKSMEPERKGVMRFFARRS